ncbi:AraC family transcriptional regulator [Pseudoalteromonas luteoviolacea]|uniref:AraC family transcriptional regulator n=1 Tax=Pseudoalteromonas luteoviolacea TaxID=43657 RepID=UPI0011514F7A|nr:AraC family transcriptional regulator [Pseudoalteromonas luteoviolacea]TQF72638.1 AraC family transcriptional regulator [Pseudoalteromonas luteoviolacea]
MQRTFACLNDKRMPAHFLIAMLELAEQYRVEPESLLRGSQLFLDDLAFPEAQVAPEQALYVLKKLKRELADQPQLAMELGQRIASGHGHVLFDLWRYAPNLNEALAAWARSQNHIETLLQLNVQRHQGEIYIRLTESASLSTQQRSVFELALSACRLLLKEQLGAQTWLKVELPWAQPSHNFHYPVYLGEHIEFNAPRCAIILSEQVLYQPFKEASVLRFAQTKRAVRLHRQASCLLQAHLRRLIRRRLSDPWNLDITARSLGMSPATLKRRLKQDGTNFKLLVDEVKGQEALHLMALNQWNNSQLASNMAFSDEHSFRRAFKRWTGAVPSAFRCN